MIAKTSVVVLDTTIVLGGRPLPCFTVLVKAFWKNSPSSRSSFSLFSLAFDDTLGSLLGLPPRPPSSSIALSGRKQHPYLAVLPYTYPIQFSQLVLLAVFVVVSVFSHLSVFSSIFYSLYTATSSQLIRLCITCFSRAFNRPYLDVTFQPFQMSSSLLAGSTSIYPSHCTHAGLLWIIILKMPWVTRKARKFSFLPRVRLVESFKTSSF
ncbi:hypothetical protein F5884DRAFT_259421 [Xylogone sp. PMI_703]|nr:hypothetical protein F5884DRAFT_259421 [Xylogone sp. PMI_703]